MHRSKMEHKCARVHVPRVEVGVFSDLWVMDGNSKAIVKQGIDAAGIFKHRPVALFVTTQRVGESPSFVAIPYWWGGLSRLRVPQHFMSDGLVGEPCVVG